MVKTIFLKKITGAYFVFKDDVLIYSYRKKSSFFKSRSQLFDANNRLIAESISQLPNLFTIHSTIFPINKEIVIHWKNILYKPTIYTTFNNEFFEIILHKKNRISLFKNDIQIGFIEEQDIYFFTNKKIKIVYKEDEDDTFILTFILNALYDFSEDEIINLNFGKTWFEKKPFDEGWLMSLPPSA